MPGGRLIFQPSMLVSSHEMQILKNQRLHGISVPSSVALGSGTDVVTGNTPASAVELELVSVGGDVVGPGAVVASGPVVIPSDVRSGVVLGDVEVVEVDVIVPPLLSMITLEGESVDDMLKLCPGPKMVLGATGGAVVEIESLADGC